MKANIDIKTGKIEIEVGSLSELQDFINNPERAEPLSIGMNRRTYVRRKAHNHKRYPNHRKAFTKSDKLILKEALAFNKDYHQVAKVMGRKPASVYMALWNIRKGRR